jgi:GntR family transcriptional regulator
VTYRPDNFATLRVPVSGMRIRGEIYAPDDQLKIVSAEMFATGGAVAGVLGVEAGAPAVLRRGVVHRGKRLIRMSHSWFPPELAELVPELLQVESSKPGSVARIEAATGRRTAITTDHMTVDTADLTLSRQFDIPQGEPVLVRTTTRHDGHGVIEYGMTWFPRYVVLAMEYTDPAVVAADQARG